MLVKFLPLRHKHCWKVLGNDWKIHCALKSNVEKSELIYGNEVGAFLLLFAKFFALTQSLFELII
jgi:hypothetical protein